MNDCINKPYLIVIPKPPCLHRLKQTLVVLPSNKVTTFKLEILKGVELKPVLIGCLRVSVQSFRV